MKQFCSRMLLLVCVLFVCVFLSNSVVEAVGSGDLPEGARARLSLGKGYLNEIAYSADGKHFAVGSSKGVWLYDAVSFEELALLEGHTRGVRSIAFSLDGQVFASGGRDATIRLWNVQTHAHLRTLRGHTDEVKSIAFSPDGQTLEVSMGRI